MDNPQQKRTTRPHKVNGETPKQKDVVRTNRERWHAIAETLTWPAPRESAGGATLLRELRLRRGIDA